MGTLGRWATRRDGCARELVASSRTARRRRLPTCRRCLRPPPAAATLAANGPQGQCRRDDHQRAARLHQLQPRQRGPRAGRVRVRVRLARAGAGCPDRSVRGIRRGLDELDGSSGQRECLGVAGLHGAIQAPVRSGDDGGARRAVRGRVAAGVGLPRPRSQREVHAGRAGCRAGGVRAVAAARRDGLCAPAPAGRAAARAVACLGRDHAADRQAAAGVAAVWTDRLGYRVVTICCRIDRY